MQKGVMMNDALLTIKNLSVSFPLAQKSTSKDYQAVHNMNLSVKRKEILAVIGASGSGKSLLAHAILGILPGTAQTGGEVFYKGRLLDKKELKKYLGKEIAFIPQSLNYLDPRMKIGPQIKGLYGTKNDVAKILKQYELQSDVTDLYPFQLSGGMARRTLFATTLLYKPSLVIADEPTPGMTAEQSSRVMKDLKKIASAGAGVLLITHDIELAVSAADRIAVTYNGSIIEIADAKAFSGKGSNLVQPFTRALWLALPENDFISAEGLAEWY